MKKLILAYRHSLIVLILSLLAILNLCTPGLFMGHDTQDHVARIANFYTNLQEGAIIPRWAGNLNWGYGHPILMFLYPLPSYIASAFHFIGLSLVDSLKLVFALGYLASGLTMYLWIREITGNRGGFVGAILYQFAPYRFVDLYVRGAIGEHMFFVFPPLVCYFITKLSQERKALYIIGGSLSVAGMILSHNALSIMFIPFISIYTGIMYLKVLRKLMFLINNLLIFLFGFGLSAFFWLPALLEGKYTLRDIVTAGEIFKRFEPMGRLFYSPWSYGGQGQMSVQVGIVHWLIIAAALFLLYRLFNKTQRLKDAKTQKSSFILLLGLLIFFCLSIFFILDISKPVYETITIFQKFQFPWRWLSLSVFTSSVVGGVLISYIPKKFQIYVVSVIILLAILPTVSYWKAKEYKVYEENYFTGVYYGTTDTGESSPIWSVRFMLKEPEAHAQVIDGDASIQETGRTTRNHSYSISVVSDQARIIENTLYFPGWFLYIDNKKQSVESIQFQDRDYHGIMTYYLPKGEHQISFVFEETNLRKLANVISLISLVGIAGLFIIKKRIALI